MEIRQYAEIGVIGVGEESLHSPENSVKYASPIHFHDFYEIFLISKGSTLHAVNNEYRHLPEGSLVFIRPTDVHYYKIDEDPDCQFINICYTRKAVCDIFKFLGRAFLPQRLLLPNHPPTLLLSPMEKDHLIHRLQRIHALSTHDSGLRRIQLRGILIEVLLQFFGPAQVASKHELPLWLESLLVQMQKKECFSGGLQKMYFISKRSPGHLNRAFQKHLRTTPTQYINGLRLDYARTLLATTYLSITDIALDAGFNNLSHFYHLFKKRFGVPPSEFKNHI